MRRANKKFISLVVVLIALMSVGISAFADPLSIGIGLPIAEATGLSIGFSGMSASGADGWFNDGSGSDPVQLATNYVDVDLANDVPIKYRKNQDNTVDFQIDKDSYIFEYFNNANGLYTSGAIHNLITNKNITTGQTDTELFNSNTFNGVPFGIEVATINPGQTVTMPGGVVMEARISNTTATMFLHYNGSTFQVANYAQVDYPFYLSYVYHSTYQFRVRYNNHRNANNTTSLIGYAAGTLTPSTISYGSGADFIYDGDGDQYVHINIPEILLGSLVLSNPYGNLTGEDFINLTEDLGDVFVDEVKKAQTSSIYSNEDIGGDPPVPPQPIPDTPLGDVPFDDWVDLWGQSIWDRLTRIEEKQELMVINQEDGLESLEDLQGIGHDMIEDVDDIIGLETDINENLEDMITYEQGISEDVESLDENVEDIEDEVIVIVDEMGNVIDVLEGIDAKLYAQGQQLGSISTEVGNAADTAEAIQTEVETQTETLEEVKEAVEDMVPYVAPLPDIATDTETMVDILPDIATATQTSTQTLTDTLPDIKDATETITDTLPDIITEIQDATTTLTDDIPNIDDICLNIDEAPYKDIDTGVDRLPRFLLPFITDLRSSLGIWHYVTEWLAQISTTFAFISGCLVGTTIMTPIYAAIAGFMCIKVYRRMTS